MKFNFESLGEKEGEKQVFLICWATEDNNYLAIQSAILIVSANPLFKTSTDRLDGGFKTFLTIPKEYLARDSFGTS